MIHQNWFFLISLAILFSLTSASEAQNTNAIDQFNKFANYYSKGDFINAENCLRDLEKAKEQLTKESLIALYNNFGVINNLLGRYEEAFHYFNLAESAILYDKQYSTELADIYINKARIYGIIKEPDKAIEYLEQGITIYLINRNSDKSILYRVSGAYLNLGITYFEKKEYNIALQYLEKSKNIKLKNNLPEIALTYLNLAKGYTKLNSKDQAQQFFLKSIESFNKEFGKDYYRTSGLLFDYGLFLRSIGENAEAFNIHQKALSICLKNYGKKHTLVSLAYKHLGDHFFILFDYQTSLKYYQKSLIAVVADFNDTDILANPSLNSVIFDIRLLDNLKQKAKALELYSQQQTDSNSRQKLLVKSLETVELAIQLIERIRNGYLSAESRIYLAENEKETYFLAVKVAKELFELSKRQEYLYKMYSICCKSKSAVLRNEIKENELMKGNSVSDSVRDKRNRLSINIASYSKLIQDELQRKTPDSLKIELWKTTLFDLNRQKERVSEKIKILFPQMETILQRTEPTSLTEIQANLYKDATLIEYLLSNQYSQGKREYFMFTITMNSIDYCFANLDSLHAKQVDMIKLGTEKKSPVTDQEYSDALFYMYQKFIEPIQNKIRGNRLIVIPDEELAYLPFEAFVKSKTDLTSDGFDGLKYLLHDYTISYGYSSSFLNAKHNNLSSTVYAFSPYYKISADGTAQSYNTLHGAGLEIKSVYKWFKGKVFEGRNATESNFKHSAKESAIFHLAMHSNTDSNNSKYSYFIFDNQHDTIDDGKLYNYEIGTSSIESPMVVLSACSTGSGILFHGEGVMSLARGFILAGASSAISTFWDVNDDASASIIASFYSYLKNGKAKDDALRLAKLDYLKNSPPTYTKPTYWAAYELIGDRSPVRIRSKKYIYSGGLLIIGVLVFYFIRSRRS